MKTGKIIITDKFYFEPDGLEKPDGMDYGFNTLGKRLYFIAIEKYEASKQLIEVENVNQVGENEYSWIIINTVNKYKIENKQPCKAEIKDNKATIISLIKE